MMQFLEHNLKFEKKEYSAWWVTYTDKGRDETFLRNANPLLYKLLNIMLNGSGNYDLVDNKLILNINKYRDIEDMDFKAVLYKVE